MTPTPTLHPGYWLWLLLPWLLVGCATSPPSRIDDACVILDEKSGWVGNWQRDLRRAEREFGVPQAVIMATIWQESRFEAKARPPRRRLLGFIPWKRQSSAYGYAQALDGTWDWYLDSTGGGILTRRSSFKHAAHFVAWYHAQSHRINGIARNDAYNLYLAYHEGHGGYRRRSYHSKPWLITVARRVHNQANRYQQQLAHCRR